MVNFWLGFTDMNKMIVFESNLKKDYIISYGDKNAV